MSWFKTDDQLPDHRKARAVRKSHPSKRRDVAPFGIWVLAGAWSDDGFVPLEILEDWDDDAADLAERLVAAGLWHATVRDGEPGFIFHDWHDQNPTRNDNDPSSTGTFGNHIRWHVQRQMADPDCRHCPSEPDESSADDRPDIGPMSPPDIGVIGAESLPSRPVPTPTRPDPSQPLSRVPHSESDGPDQFDEFWCTYDKKVDRKGARAKWVLALRKPGVTADMLIAAAREYVAWERANNDGGRYIMGPAKWLLNERWTDERVARAQPRTRVQEHLALVQQLAAEEQQPRQIGDGR